MMEPKEYTIQLSRVIERRSQQDTILWQMFAIFAAANGFIFAEIVAAETMDLFWWKALWFGLGGSAMCLVWCLLQQRAIWHIKALENSARNLEIDLQIPNSKSVMPRDTGGMPICHLISARDLMELVARLLLGLWIVFFLVALILKISSYRSM